MNGPVVAFDALRALQRRANELSGARPTDWRRNLAQLRLEIARALPALGAAIATAGESPDGAPSDLARTFQRLRSAISLHQADWPASAIDVENAAFRASLARVRAAYDDMARAIAAFAYSNGEARRQTGATAVTSRGEK